MSLPQFYQQYIDLVSDRTRAFQESEEALLKVIKPLSEEQMLYAYAPNKWTIKEMLQHLNDTERIFAYRLLCFARNESYNLPGFEEDDYVKASYANTRSKEELLQEFSAIRKATNSLVESLKPDDYSKKGKANGLEISIEEIIAIINGHVLHHVIILKERYLNKLDNN